MKVGVSWSLLLDAIGAEALVEDGAKRSAERRLVR